MKLNLFPTPKNIIFYTFPSVFFPYRGCNFKWFDLITLPYVPCVNLTRLPNQRCRHGNASASCGDPRKESSSVGKQIPRGYGRLVPASFWVQSWPFSLTVLGLAAIRSLRGQTYSTAMMSRTGARARPDDEPGQRTYT